MGFVLWYRVTVSTPGPIPVPLVRASNDVFSGEHLLDTEIEVPMIEGDTAGEFRISLVNLPASIVEAVKSAQLQGADTRKPMQVKVELGYFDRIPLLRPPRDVLVGAVTRVTSSVNASGQMVTELRGYELATWRLLRLCNPSFSQQGPVTPSTCVDHVLKQLAGEVAQQGMLIGGEPRTNFVLRAPNGLAALGELARWANVRFAVRDGSVHWATPGPSLPGPAISSDTNLVALDDGQSAGQPTRLCSAPENATTQSESTTRIQATVLGEPALRPGQAVPVQHGTTLRTLHVQAVTHHFSTSTGYVCELVLSENGGGAAGTPATGAHGVVHRIRELSETRRDQRPAINIGEVTQYESGASGKHVATVNFGQNPGADVVAPSVESPVLEDTQLHQRPIASPFAWHKCGLMVPAYPGQRALLEHNRGSMNDAVLAGYVWAEEPTMERPANEPGDWWLCLPTQLSGGQPAGKGANDLTDAAGLRVIQAKGLKIDVGEDKLASVGARPTVPDPTTLTIDHAGGTQIKIASDGSVEITTDATAISLSNGTSSLTLDGSTATLSNGTSSLTLDGASAKLTNGSVTVAASGSAVEIS
jgi:hypothetical protein